MQTKPTAPAMRFLFNPKETIEAPNLHRMRLGFALCHAAEFTGPDVYIHYGTDADHRHNFDHVGNQAVVEMVLMVPELTAHRCWKLMVPARNQRMRVVIDRVCMKSSDFTLFVFDQDEIPLAMIEPGEKTANGGQYGRVTVDFDGDRWVAGGSGAHGNAMIAKEAQPAICA